MHPLFNLITVLILTLPSITWACELEGFSLANFDNSSDYQILTQEQKAPPTVLKKFAAQIGSFNSQECRAGFNINTYLDKKTKKFWTLLFSHHDECDGGNTYGLVIEGPVIREEKVIATIEDSNLYCLP